MINLFFNYYQSDSRQHEIDECLRMNKLVFDNVILVHDRPTFNDLFKLSENYPNDINCYCNSDCYFESTKLLLKIKENECYALTRNDLAKNNRINFQSQDAWCFNGVVKNVNADFPQGKWGCDNRLAYELKEAGYSLINPCKQINLIHLHAIDNRDNKRTNLNTVPPPYHFVHPSEI
ncbi:hypothetical protein [uncultured Flavobacterium sp.]|mgnify:CR=1 FL=1|uniref:hypothetical protein n=1 Tax=uncultured Flavobacterium sp. TaxID=165435 RepID=UPI00259ACD64|nr:hypothetical protein [uncultured Flavobacterium sp.]